MIGLGSIESSASYTDIDYAFYVDSSFYNGAIRLSNITLSPLNDGGISVDVDGDGYSNDIDLDSDTIPDVIEASLIDNDANLMIDSINQQASVNPAPDIDGDGIPDYLDLKSHNAANDGSDYDMHLNGFSGYDSNNDGQFDTEDDLGGQDSNRNGVDDLIEVSF